MGVGCTHRLDMEVFWRRLQRRVIERRKHGLIGEIETKALGGRLALIFRGVGGDSDVRRRVVERGGTG